MREHRTFHSVRLVPFLVAAVLALACSSSNNNNTNKSASNTNNAPASATRPATTAAPGASLATATTAAAPGEKPVRGGTLTVAIDSNTKNLDPLKSSLVVDRQIHYQIYDSLVAIDQNLKIIPALAMSWDTSDPKAIVFKLRQGVKFQDGTDFNADAVKFNIDRILNSQSSPRKGEIPSVASVDVVDPYTVRFNLKAPAAPLLATLVDRAGMMLSPAAVQKYGDDLTLTPINAGTGPFKFVEWKQDDHVTVERNPDYWGTDAGGGKLPYLDRITFKVIVDENQRLNAVKAGDVDQVYRPPAKDIAAVKKDSSLVYKDVPALSFDRIELNVAAEPFNNKALREAFAWCIDRDQIVQTVNYGIGQAGTGPLAPPMPAFDTSFKPFSRDIAKAKAKLAEGGKPSGFSFDLLITANSPANQQFGELIKDQCKDAGITVNLVPEEFTKLIDDSQNHRFQASSQGWSGRIDPDGNTYNHFHTGGGLNDSQYSNQQVDQLLEQAASTYDTDKRNQLYRQANQLIVQDVPSVFTTYTVAAELHTPKVKGYVNYADTIMRFATVWKAQ
jgi:peptide/nickel transport system substrate-binding protein